MSIIKARELSNSGTLVFGLPADGKTTAIANDVVRNNFNPLWIVFTNADLLAEKYPDWDVALITDWAEFEVMFRQMVKGEIDTSIYDVVVIEGLNYAATQMLSTLIMPDTKDQRPLYLEMGRVMNATLSKMRGMFKSLFVTLDLQKDAEGNIEFAVNRDLLNKVLSLLGSKIYVSSQPKRDKNNKVVGIEYLEQRNPTYALRFQPIQRVDIKE